MRTIPQVNTASDYFSTWYSITNQLANSFLQTVTVNTTADLTTGNGYVNGYFGANTIVVGTGLRGGNVTSAANLVISSNLTSSLLVSLTGNVVVNSSLISLTSNNIQISSNSTVDALKVTANSTATNTTIAGSIINLSSNTSVSGATLNITANTTLSGNTIINGPTTINAAATVVGALSIGTGTSYSSNVITTTGNSAQLIDSTNTATFKTVKYIVSVKDNAANNFQATEIMALQDTGAVYTTEYATLVSNNIIGTFTANISGTACRLYITPTVANTTINLVKIIIS